MRTQPTFHAIAAAIWLAALAGLGAPDVRAAVTDLAATPLVTASSVAVKPNLMFVLDDSGSMGWTELPDSVWWGSNYASDHCYKNSAYNKVYYNPSITYAPGVDSSGTSLGNATFTGARDDGYHTYDSVTGTTDLSTSFRAYDYGSGARDTAQAAYYYKYKSSNSPSTPVAGTCYGDSSYTKVVVSATSSLSGGDERQNFANWYSYYRTRMLMMKTAAGETFKTIGSNYRVGFTTINSTIGGSEFLDIADFDSTQKSAWYTKFYGITPSGGTPLRGALAKVGRMYGGQFSGHDPIQYSCQQNFTILSTDGYWNGSTSDALDLAGTATVGNQDNDATVSPRPLFDGGTATSASDTLADVAMYYYKTDLRPTGSTGALGTDVSADDVPGSGDDKATWQHMTTFTLGLGAPGNMTYSSTYKTDTSGDFYNVKVGTFNSNSSSTPCSWEGKKKQCNWPVPSSGTASTIDDLWHAAVNGRGTYFSATDPTSLTTGLSGALAGVSARNGTAAAATTSNPNVTSGDNFIFSSTFTTVDWSGELTRQQLNLTTGEVSSTVDWAAQAKLDTKVGASSDTRTIYTFDAADATAPGTKLKPFLWANLTAAEQADFGATNVATLSQYPSLTATQKTDAAGQNLVNFLRGQTGNQDTATVTTNLYRYRQHTLGDIVSAEAVYVKAPIYNYSDAYYSTFKTNNASRQGVVYAAANDGMLHAFNADTGEEMWAYIPSMVMPSLYKLADKNYGSQHRYSVDGTPTVGDVCMNTTLDATTGKYVCNAVNDWHTILVGGLNGGGRGYYALDITNPSSPKALWEFTVRDPSVTTCAATTTAAVGAADDCDLGYSYGNPIITKKKDGTWTVMVTSGYNNVSPGDGQGYLYVLNAKTGVIINKIGTGHGSTGSPSGLAKINAWVDDPMTDNTTLRVYGGDLTGYLWRFDVNGDITTAGVAAQALATFKGGGASPQPITTKPELGDVNGHPVVYVGTGRYLGTTDLADTSPQSFYAIKDPLDTTNYGNVRTNAAMVKQTLTTTTNAVTGAQIRTGSNNAVDFATNIGWYIDLPDSGERVNTDPTLGLGTLVFTTNVPNSNACTVGGYSWIYFLDYRSGTPVATSGDGTVAEKLGNSLATRPILVRLPNNTVEALTRLSEGRTVKTDVPIGGGGVSLKRINWREISE